MGNFAGWAVDDVYPMGMLWKRSMDFKLVEKHFIGLQSVDPGFSLLILQSPPSS